MGRACGGGGGQDHVGQFGPRALLLHNHWMALEGFTEKACKVFRDCSLVPTLSAARIRATTAPAVGSDARYEVEARWTQRELLRGKKLTWSKSYFVEENGGKLEKLFTTGFQADATRV